MHGPSHKTLAATLATASVVITGLMAALALHKSGASDDWRSLTAMGVLLSGGLIHIGADITLGTTGMPRRYATFAEQFGEAQTAASAGAWIAVAGLVGVCGLAWRHSRKTSGGPRNSGGD